MKVALYFILLLNIIIYISCQKVKLGADPGIKLGGDDDLNSYEEDHSMDDLIQKLVKEYVEDKKWKPEQQIDKDTFVKMFVYLIQRGALRQGSSGILKKLADKILQKHGEPIIVKNLNKYFDIMEITLGYTQILNPTDSDSDL